MVKINGEGIMPKYDCDELHNYLVKVNTLLDKEQAKAKTDLDKKYIFGQRMAIEDLMLSPFVMGKSAWRKHMDELDTIMFDMFGPEEYRNAHF